MLFLFRYFFQGLGFGATRWLAVLCQVILVIGLIFGSLSSVPAQAAETSDNGIIGFSACRFGTAEEIRQKNNAPAGNETIRQCLQQILTFVFVLGIFLIGMRIAIEAFKSLNPAISGNSIDNSVKLGKDVIIGLILIGAPSIFLGLFNQAALQLPNLFELARFAPKEGEAQTTTKPTTGTPSGATGGGGTATGTGGGTGGGIGDDTDLLVDGKKVPQSEIDAAKKARDDRKTLTDRQKQILDALDKQNNPNQNIFVNSNLSLPRSKVEEALKYWQENKIRDNDSQVKESLNIARSLLENCLTSKESLAGGDQTSCQLLKSNVELAHKSIFVDYSGSKEFKLPVGFSRTNQNDVTRVGGTGTDYNIQLINDKSQEVEIVMKCSGGAAVAQASPLNQPASFSSKDHLGKNLLPQGCTAEMRVTKI